MKTVIEMAREAGIVGNFWPELERFAELVRADEREDILRISYSQWFKSQSAYDEAIKAKGNALCKGRVEAAVEAEREACARVCEELAKTEWADNERCAAAIRARGTHE